MHRTCVSSRWADGNSFVFAVKDPYIHTCRLCHLCQLSSYHNNKGNRGCNNHLSFHERPPCTRLVTNSVSTQCLVYGALMIIIVDMKGPLLQAKHPPTHSQPTALDSHMTVLHCTTWLSRDSIIYTYHTWVHWLCNTRLLHWEILPIPWPLSWTWIPSETSPDGHLVPTEVAVPRTSPMHSFSHAVHKAGLLVAG